MFYELDAFADNEQQKCTGLHLDWTPDTSEVHGALTIHSSALVIKQ